MTDTITGAQLSAVTFAPAKGFSRTGYDPQEVDTFLRRTAAAVDQLNEQWSNSEAQLHQARAEVQRLRDRIEQDSKAEHVQHAISVLTTAQITADSTVAQADQYSARVMEQARDLYEDTRRNAAALEQDTQNKARAMYDDAIRRASEVEHDNKDRLAQLTLAATTAQRELDEQTTYLRTLRDSTHIHMEKFLEGLLDHLAEEYRKAHPPAAQAADGTATTTSNGSPTPHTGIVLRLTS